jgi:hypothetical protein
MQQIGTVSFNDRASLQPGIAVIRADAGQMALALSLEGDGDIEVVVDVAAGEQLIEALQRALLWASSNLA